MSTKLTIDPSLLASVENAAVIAKIDSVTANAVTLIVGDKPVAIAVPEGGFEDLKPGATGSIVFDKATGAATQIALEGRPIASTTRRSSPAMGLSSGREVI